MAMSDRAPSAAIVCACGHRTFYAVVEGAQRYRLLCVACRRATEIVASPGLPDDIDLDYCQLLTHAKRIVRESVLYRRFIDGTPLENDLAVWMADFVYASVAVAARRGQIGPGRDNTPYANKQSAP